jgi:hypothetical protein
MPVIGAHTIVHGLLTIVLALAYAAVVVFLAQFPSVLVGARASPWRSRPLSSPPDQSPGVTVVRCRITERRGRAGSPLLTQRLGHRREPVLPRDVRVVPAADTQPAGRFAQRAGWSLMAATASRPGADASR